MSVNSGNLGLLYLNADQVIQENTSPPSSSQIVPLPKSISEPPFSQRIPIMLTLLSNWR